MPENTALTPIYRVSRFLNAIIHNTTPDSKPVYSVELWLAKIAGVNVQLLEPGVYGWDKNT